MLCKAGGLSKNDIGAIRVRTEETHVELAPSCVTQFLETVGPDRVLERTVRVTQMDGPPADARPGVAASPPPAAKKPYNADRKPRDAEASHTQASPEKAESAPPQVKPAAREPYSKPTVAREPYRKPKDAGNSRPARNDDGPGKPRAKAPYKKPKSDEPFRKPQGDQPYRKSKGAGPARDQNGPKPKGKKTATDPVFRQNHGQEPPECRFVRPRQRGIGQARIGPDAAAQGNKNLRPEILGKQPVPTA